MVGVGLLVRVDAETVELPRQVGLALRGDRPLGALALDPPDLVTVDRGVDTVDGTAAVAALRACGPSATQREAKAAIVKAIDQVAEQLNNTRAVCRKYYIHPTVFETYAAGTMLEALANGDVSPASEHALSSEEEAIVRMLKRKG